MLKQTLMSGSESIGLQLSQLQVKKFLNYLDMLVEWNRKFNLTAIKEPEEIIIKHFLDSLLLAPFINPDARLADVGTGAGFPGLPLKIVYPELDLTLIDSLGKRVSFLQEVVKVLHLNSVQAIHTRVEDISHKSEYREKFDAVVTRAVAKMSVISEYCLPLVKVHGQFLAAKGPNVSTELPEAEYALKILGGKLSKVEITSLPGRNDSRSIVVIDKIKSTPQQYPRKAGIPDKKPLEGTV